MVTLEPVMMEDPLFVLTEGTVAVVTPELEVPPGAEDEPVP